MAGEGEEQVSGGPDEGRGVWTGGGPQVFQPVHCRWKLSGKNLHLKSDLTNLKIKTELVSATGVLQSRNRYFVILKS